jgi:hypothetical protein
MTALETQIHMRTVKKIIFKKNKATTVGISFLEQ